MAAEDLAKSIATAASILDRHQQENSTISVLYRNTKRNNGYYLDEGTNDDVPLGENLVHAYNRAAERGVLLNNYYMAQSLATEFHMRGTYKRFVAAFWQTRK